MGVAGCSSHGLGLEARDSCYSSTISQQRSLDYASGKIDITSVTGQVCPATTLRPGEILGNSIMLMNTQPVISGPMAPFFTDPFTKMMDASTTDFQKATIDLAKALGWSYLSIVYIEDTMQAAMDGIAMATDNNICIAGSYEIHKTDSSGYGDVIRSLMDKPDAIGVILLLDFSDTLDSFFSSVENYSFGNTEFNLVWIIPNIGYAEPILQAHENVTRGAIGVGAASPEIEDFLVYFRNLGPGNINTTSDPWFEQYYQTKYKCDIASNTNYGVQCDQTVADKHKLTQQIQGVPTVMNSIKILVEAVMAAHTQVCPSDGFCEQLANIPDYALLGYVNAVDFTGYDNSDISFSSSGEFIPQIDILNFQSDGNGGYALMQVANTMTLNTGDSVRNVTKVWQNNVEYIADDVTSMCSAPCNDVNCQAMNDMSYIQGDITLGGMFAVHFEGETPDKCGPIHPTGVIRLEAMMYAIDKINADNNILPGLKLGMIGGDSCYSAKQIKQKTMAFIGAADFSKGVVGVQTSPIGQRTHIMGTIGTTRSSLAIAMNDVTRILMVPQIAYSATSPLLSDKEMFPNFFRTSPSDRHQARVMIHIAQSLGWKYIQTINSDSAYGNAGVEALRQYARTVADLCIASSHVIKDSSNNDEMDSLINRLLSRAEARGLLVFLSNTDSRALLQKFTEEGLQGNFSFVAADAWGISSDVINTLESAAAGAIVILPTTNSDLSNFASYLLSREVDNNPRNPWFRSYWMHKFQCQLSGEYSTFGAMCPDGLSLSAEDANADYVANTIDAVNAMALAIDQLHKQKCPGSADICDNFLTSSSEELLDKLRAVSFESATGLGNFEFDEYGDGKPMYTVYNLQKDTSTSLYAYNKVGSWEDNTLDMNDGVVILYDSDGEPINPTDSFESDCKSNGSCAECVKSEITFAHMDGHIEIPVLFGISEQGENTLLCGDVLNDQVINVEAILFALDKVNEDDTILPGVTLGATIIDTCSSPQRAMSQTLLALIGDSKFGNNPDNTMAIIGAVLNDVSMEMLRVTDAVKKSQVSFGSSSIELTKERYPYFLRTVPVDDRQAEVMVSILKKYDWYYVSTVRSNTSYGQTGMEDFMTKANDEGVCAAVQLTIPSNPTQRDYVRIITDLITEGDKKGSNVVVLFTSQEDTRNLLKYAETKAKTYSKQSYHFTWVAPDSWGISLDVVEGYLDHAKGALTIIPLQPSMPEFEEYMESLTPISNTRNPWFRSLWETIFDCRLRLDEFSSRESAYCTGDEDLRAGHTSELHSALSSYAIDAVYAIATGLHNLRQKKCPGRNLCSEFFNSDPEDVHQEITNARVSQSATGRPFSFLEGAGEGEYAIMNYVLEQKDENTTSGKYRKVGEWLHGTLTMSGGEVQFFDFRGSNTSSVDSRCPSVCRVCYTQGIPSVEVPEMAPLVFNGDSIWGIIIIAIIVLMIVFCFVIFIYFLVEFRNPVVKGASSSLSYFLLLGITLLLLENFAFMFEPTRIVCGCRRFGLGFFHVLIWSALFCKVVRILRICGTGEINSRVPFVSPWSQTFLLLALLLVEVILVGEWLILDPPAVWHEIVETGISPPFKVVFHCNYENKWMVASLIYAFLLILLTFWCACKARKYSDLVYEGAYILFTTIASIFIMVAWLLVYSLGDEEYQNPAVCIGITSNAIIILAAIFLPKITALTSTEERAQDGPATGNDMGKSYVYSNPDVNKDDEVTAF
ncbi:uncharacterized protein LOC144449214 [Glandiceps talaboti]